MNNATQLLAEVKMRQDLIENINDILIRHDVAGRITAEDLVITDSLITDSSKERLSEFIISSIWPSIYSATVYHYTQKGFAESILNTEVLRLSNIGKRYHEGEIVAFCDTHNLTGYLLEDEEGNPAYRKLLVPNTFYASFTDSNISTEEEKRFWQDFAGSDGARLKIQIEATNPNLRHIYYEKKKGTPIPLLNEIRRCIKQHTGLEFILRGVSRLCAFYLIGSDYEHEKELRAYYKTYDDWGMQPKGSGADSYLEIPLGIENDSGYKMSILEVQARERLDIPSSYIFSKRSI
ncbi:hypothetical protein [Pseudomonas viridiflava]|jgi:hypothetical protein|uniref:hypothetical protein n=1 Tax=Pseudomonas viridiflava TaxID=33069 RepID=UPI000F01BFEB|nr:hypothetical protein [Pseudomonas viridiflava]MDY0938330.1 hypothetical protein [Pseudomonas viridiflava]MDY1015393.1 hypothetical protein [Pseudomonas viridiflava]